MSEDLKIVVIGGGTGLSVILRGLKKVSKKISAIVTVADDGGCSGVLREDLGMLPPGDIRSCILALSNEEATFQQLFKYRFEKGELNGKSLGNLMIAALNDISGDFEETISEMSDFLSITGEVLPVATTDVSIVVKLANDNIVNGESNIPSEAIRQKSKIDKIWIDPCDTKAANKTLDRIENADLIIMGPGSLYTSIIPNLLIEEISSAINKAGGKKIYISNVMTQPGETDDMSAFDHLEKLLHHTNIETIDYMLVNNEELSLEIKEKYLLENSKPVLLSDEERIKLDLLGIKYLEDKYIDIKCNYIRHDADKISEDIVNLIGNKE